MARGSNNCKIEENVVAGVPDFFYPRDYRGISNTYNWAEIDKFIKERQEIDWPVTSITGGGIDPTTGYTRRAMKEYPNLILPPPIKLDQLPDWNTFIAANIHKKQARIAAGSGEKMRKPGAKGAPTKADFIKSAKTAKKA